ncbi:hypothetical protein DM860_017757 [Cuscuta australis]|uniref:Uncharacterized protein n=1 Tax=Cuscuta australis TaxID=267555 RepID=A0A328D9U1_9ASTE|nr:hypothetical protein DM860_017757 [Cuscuta australis]
MIHEEIRSTLINFSRSALHRLIRLHSTVSTIETTKPEIGNQKIGGDGRWWRTTDIVEGGHQHQRKDLDQIFDGGGQDGEGLQVAFNHLEQICDGRVAGCLQQPKQICDGGVADGMSVTRTREVVAGYVGESLLGVPETRRGWCWRVVG